jgi:hypothetical protein
MKFAASYDTCFDDTYAAGDARLTRLYRNGQALQWDAAARIDWNENIDFENPLGYDDRFIPIWGSPQWTQASDTGRADLRRNYHAYSISQFLHGEQAAMLAAARLVEVLPDQHSKQLAAVQACDEARHVEVFHRLLKDKIGLFYPIDDGLQSLIRHGLSENRWDMVVFTAQILIEGLALAALQQLRDFSKHKLIRDIGAYVLADEARHVAFGMQLLQTRYAEMSDAELRERRAFADTGLDALTQRLNPAVVWGPREAPSNLPLLKSHLTRKVVDMTDKLFPRSSHVTKEVQYAQI